MKPTYKTVPVVARSLELTESQCGTQSFGLPIPCESHLLEESSHLMPESITIDQIIGYLSSGLDDLSGDVLLRLQSARRAALARKHA